jgi:hypothetical protein
LTIQLRAAILALFLVILVGCRFLSPVNFHKQKEKNTHGSTWF